MDEIDIKEILSYIRKYIILIILIVAVTVGLVVTYDMGFKTPLYKTYTTLVLVRTASTSLPERPVQNSFSHAVPIPGKA